MKIYKSSTFIVFVLCFLMVGFQPSVKAQTQTLREPPLKAGYEKAIKQAQWMIDTLMESQNVPGMQVAVSVGGEEVWSRGFGFADLENKAPVWPSTKMRIGSLSKTLTSVALGKLIEEGKLDVDAPVQKYVPYFPKKKYSISTRQVAGHIAGIRHYKGEEASSPEFLSAVPYASVKESLDIFKDDSLLFKPGNQFLYSTFGWSLVSAVVEGASGEDYLDYMRENVFEPLKMAATVPDMVESIILHRTSFYDKNDDGILRNAPYVDNSNKWAGGGYIGTAEDLIKFGNAMLYATYLNRKAVDELWESQKTNDGELTHYGMGWFDGETESGHKWVGHSGGSVGGTTQFIIYPDAEVVVAITSNLSGLKFYDLHFLIADLFTKE